MNFHRHPVPLRSVSVSVEVPLPVRVKPPVRVTKVRRLVPAEA